MPTTEELAAQIRDLTFDIKLNTTLRKVKRLVAKALLREAVRRAAEEAAYRHKRDQIKCYMREGAYGYKLRYGRDWPGADKL